MSINVVNIQPSQLCFDIKVQEMCKSCKRYGTKASCPPYIESVEYYKKLLPSYKHGILYYERFKVTDKTQWRKLGASSSLKIHNHLLKVRNELIQQGHYFVEVFGAGSCKMCAKCTFPCHQPDKSITPLEGTGVNIFKLLKKLNIPFVFPIKDSFLRVGVVLYD